MHITPTSATALDLIFTSHTERVVQYGVLHSDTTDQAFIIWNQMIRG